MVDCQTDLLAHIATRFVIPLIPIAEAPSPTVHLNPIVSYDDQPYMLLTQTAASVDKRDLGPPLGSLEDRRLDIIGAIDVLITGV